MRLFLFSLTILLTCNGFAVASKPQTGVIIHREYDMPLAGKKIPYTMYVPKKYDGTKDLPVVFALHGLLSNCYQMIRYPGIVPAAEKHGFILVAPQGYNNHGWYGMYGKHRDSDTPKNLGELSERDVINVMNSIRNELKIDARKIYLYGHSMGGGGSLHLLSKYPEQFAAVATVAPAYFVPEPGKRIASAKSPIMIIQGTRDPLVNVHVVRSLVKLIEQNKQDVKYIEVEGGGHLVPAWSPWDEIFGFYKEAKSEKPAPLPAFK